jgi:glycosyltransferase involved in cell wall biosynthesis
LGRLEVDELTAPMRRASIYALPARYEPFGLSALEAALHGCALVLGDVPSLREVWGDAAEYVSPDDHDALAHTISSLCADAPRRRALEERAREREALYPPERTAASYLALYRRIGAASSAPAGPPRRPRSEPQCA